MDASTNSTVAEDIGVEEDSSTEDDETMETDPDDDVLRRIDPALLTMATICLKAAKPLYVSPFAWRLVVYNHSRGKVDCTRIMNRILLSASYSFLRKVKSEFSKLRDAAYQSTTTFARDCTGVLSRNRARQAPPLTPPQQKLSSSHPLCSARSPARTFNPKLPLGPCVLHPTI